MQFRKMSEVLSRGTSPMIIFDEEPDSNEKEDTDHLTQEHYAALSLQHAEELKDLQEQYEYSLI